mgnify:FL=1
MLDIIVGIIGIAVIITLFIGAWLLHDDKQRAYILKKNSIALHKRMQGSIDDDTARDQ